MTRNRFIGRSALVLLGAALAVMANAAPEGDGITAEERIEVRQQEQAQQQHRDRDVQAEMPGGEEAARQQQQEKAGEAPAPGPAVKQGPYGDKQYHKKKGSPALAGEQGAAQEKGSR